MFPEEISAIASMPFHSRYTMTHRTKGGVYRIIGLCKVQINGVWKDGFTYEKCGELTLYVRALTDAEKLEVIYTTQPIVDGRSDSDD